MSDTTLCRSCGSAMTRAALVFGYTRCAACAEGRGEPPGPGRRAVMRHLERWITAPPVPEPERGAARDSARLGEEESANG